MQIHLKKLTLVACLTLAAAIGGLSGCHTEGRSAGTYIDDRLVSSRVKGALNDSATYKFPNVDVAAFNGTVQLNGFVANADQKQQAEQIASRVEGVRQLVNNLTIQAPGTTPTGRATGTDRPDQNVPNANGPSQPQ